MTVYVDPLEAFGWKLRGHSIRSCHLFTDSLDLSELHALARRIGLRACPSINLNALPAAAPGCRENGASPAPNGATAPTTTSTGRPCLRLNASVNERVDLLRSQPTAAPAPAAASHATNSSPSTTSKAEATPTAEKSAVAPPLVATPPTSGCAGEATRQASGSFATTATSRSGSTAIARTGACPGCSCWFQNKAAAPHYDLTPAKRAAAIAAGAVAVDRRGAVGIWRARRAMVADRAAALAFGGCDG